MLSNVILRHSSYTRASTGNIGITHFGTVTAFRDTSRLGELPVDLMSYLNRFPVFLATILNVLFNEHNIIIFV